jgi:hypothetical protein
MLGRATAKAEKYDTKLSMILYLDSYLAYLNPCSRCKIDSISISSK